MVAIALIVLGAIGLGSIVGGLVMSRQSADGLVEERLGIAEDRPRRRRPREERAAPLTEALDRVLTERGIGSDLATQLARADLKLTVGEYIALATIVVVLAGILTYAWRRDFILSGAACLIGFPLHPTQSCRIPVHLQENSTAFRHCHH